MLAALAAEYDADLIAAHLIPPLPQPVELLAGGGTSAATLGPPGKIGSTTAEALATIARERIVHEVSPLRKLGPWAGHRHVMSLSILVGDDSCCVVTIGSERPVGAQDFYDACSPVGLLTQMIVDRRTIEQLKKDLHDQIQDRSLLNATLHHDLRTPLCAILGSARTLQSKWDSLEATDRDGLLESLSRQSERMDRMLTETLSKQAAGPGAPVKTMLTDVRALCEKVAQAAAISRDGDVTVESESIPIATDPDRLERALLNLVDNALRYGSHDAAVYLIVEEEGPVLTITVADNGGGVAPEVLPGLFGAYTTDPSRTDGTGLGLHSARRLIEELGGRIGYSRHSEWTRFTVSLPHNLGVTHIES